VPETSPAQALVDAKPLTMQEAEGMPREEVEARLSQMTSEERMAFFQELDTEDRVNETIGAMQKFSQDEREREGIAPQNIEVVEVDDRGRVVNVEIKPTSETPAAQEREGGENEAAGEHLPEPVLPVFEETDSYQITESGPDQARGPEIYDGESFGENEAKDQENNFEQNNEILPENQENLDGSIKEEAAETSPESMDEVSPETETETLPEYLVDGGFLESKRENVESELPAPEQAGELETEVAGFAAQLERVTSRELAEHDRRIDLLERKQQHARRMNAQLDTYARYTRMYEELRRTQLRLVAMEAELEKAA